MASSIAEVLLRIRDEASKGLADVADGAENTDERVRRLRMALDELSDGNRKAGDSADHLGQRAGALGGNAMKLAGALSIVSPAAADMARNLGDLADVAEVTAAVSGATGVSVVALGGALGATTALAIAGYGAWRIYSAEERVAEAVSRDLAAAQRELQPLLDNTRDAEIDLAEATGAISSLMADLERNSLRSLRAWSSATEDTRKRVYELRREQDSLTTQVIDAGQAFYDAVDPTGLLSEGYQKLWGGSRELQVEIDALSGALDDSVVDLEKNRTTTENVLIANNKATEGEKAHAAAMRDSAAAAGELARAQDEVWRSLQREISATEKARDGIIAMAAADAALQLSRGDTSGTRTDAQVQAAAIRQQELERLKAPTYGTDETKIADQREFRKHTEALANNIMALEEEQRAREDAARATQEKTREDRRAAAAAAAGRAASVVNTISSGPEATMGAVATATGPWGALVVGIINTVVHLEDTINAWKAYHEQLWSSIEDIPNIIMRAIKDGLLEGMADIVDGIVGFVENLADQLDDILLSIVKSIPEVTNKVLNAVMLDLPAAVWQLVKTIFSPELWGELIQELWKGFGEVLTNAWGNTIESLSRLFDGFIEAIRDLFKVFDDGVFAKGGPASVGDFFGDLFLGPNRQGLLHDIWQGQNGNGGIKGLVGAFDTGTTYVPSTGLAMVHQGERILRPDQGQADRAPITIQVSANAITSAGARELVAELSRYLGPGGIGLSLEGS